MLTQSFLMEHKDTLESLIPTISDADTATLVDWLKEKDDNLRYAAFLLVQMLSAKSDRIYPFWDAFAGMIEDDNSYQRSLGLMLIAENVRWDKEGRFKKVCGRYLMHCDDEKFITSRQCIQGLVKVVQATAAYNYEIIDALIEIDLDNKKDTQKGLLLLDIAEVLEKIKNQPQTDKTLDFRIEGYLRSKAGLGNDKVKKKIKSILGDSK